MGVAAQLLSEWDGRHSHLHIDYDSLMRPIVITEQADGASSNVTERLTYADSNSESAAHNQCGALKRHDDTAGCRHLADYGLSGSVLSESRQFLIELSTPNWPQALDDRDALLETEMATTRWQFDATGAVVSQLDARRNETLTSYNVCGQLAQIELKRESLPGKVLLNQRIYSATGQIEQEDAGNGVRTVRRYDTENGRLLQLTSRLGLRCYQDCHYDYDPVGNVVRISDNAQPVRHFKNRRTTPIDSYWYDTLYQLREATGRESIPTNQGPGLPELHTPQLDPTRMGPYKQTFTYDQAGNLRSLVHEGNNSYTRTMITASSSNRSLNQPETGEPDFKAGFDANGNLRFLSPAAQEMQWDRNNRLSELIKVSRFNTQNDIEHYRYDAKGHRIRKIQTLKSKSTTNMSETRYLPHLLIYKSRIKTDRHVITIETGSISIQALHWSTPPSKAIQNDQIRYNLINHLGSNVLELNDEAQILSQEGYYPFGGTAWHAAKNVIEARHKTKHYSMKERDTSGLYYYGSRYYATWLHRWVNPDPSEPKDDLNLFKFCYNNPITYKDPNGEQPVLNGFEPDDIMVPDGLTIDQIKNIQISKGLGGMLTGTVVHQIPLPTQFTLDEPSRKSFVNAGPGTAFTAIANIYTGDIYFAPLESSGRSMPPTNRTRAQSFITHTSLGRTPNPPITHGGGSPSHSQISQRIGMSQSQVVGFSLTSGRGRGIYSMNFISRSSQNTPIIETDNDGRLTYSTPEELKKYKFVSESAGGINTRTHQVSVLPPLWGNAIHAFLISQLGEDNTGANPNLFADNTPSQTARVAAPPPPMPPPPPPPVSRAPSRQISRQIAR